MADETIKQGSGEVKVVDKYTELVLKVDEAQGRLKKWKKVKKIKIVLAWQQDLQ